VAGSAKAAAMSARIATLALMAAATALAAITIGPKPVPRLVWNASESVAMGLYGVQPAYRLIVTDLVVVFPPEPLATFLADGGYLPHGVPLIKRILALPEQTVCRTDLTITVDGVEMGPARIRDRRGRLLPVWQGCRVVRQGEVFLMNWDEPASLDGRYFGPLPIAAVVGRAVPLWTFEEE
jgi:conjugative transfer signal peptidase TraF